MIAGYLRLVWDASQKKEYRLVHPHLDSRQPGSLSICCAFVRARADLPSRLDYLSPLVLDRRASNLADYTMLRRSSVRRLWHAVSVGDVGDRKRLRVIRRLSERSMGRNRGRWKMKWRVHVKRGRGLRDPKWYGNACWYGEGANP